MEPASLGSVHNEDRIGNAGYMEQDQMPQDHRIFKTTVQKYIPDPIIFALPHWEVYTFWPFIFNTLEEQMLEESIGMESTGAVW